MNASNLIKDTLLENSTLEHCRADLILQETSGEIATEK